MKKGNEVELTKAIYSVYGKQRQKSQEGRLRRVVQHLFKQKNIGCSAECQCQGKYFQCKGRKYGSAREESLFEDNVPVAVYDNLIAAMHDNMNLMQVCEAQERVMGWMKFICTPLRPDDEGSKDGNILKKQRRL